MKQKTLFLILNGLLLSCSSTRQIEKRYTADDHTVFALLPGFNNDYLQYSMVRDRSFTFHDTDGASVLLKVNAPLSRHHFPLGDGLFIFHYISLIIQSNSGAYVYGNAV